MIESNIYMNPFVTHVAFCYSYCIVSCCILSLLHNVELHIVAVAFCLLHSVVLHYVALPKY